MKALLLIHKNFIKDNRLIFILLICCLVICFVAVFFAFSNILCSVNSNIFNITYSQGISISQLESDINDINNNNNPVVNNFIVHIDKIDDIYIVSDNNYTVMYGRFVTTMDEIVIRYNLPYEIGETYIYNDTEYVICGKAINTYLHYDAVEHNMIVNNVTINGTKSLSIRSVERIFNDYYKNSIIIDSNYGNLLKSILYQDYYQMIIVSIILATLILILIYGFFIERMKPDIMLLRVFGMTKNQCQIFYYTEMILFTLTLFIASFIIYLPLFYSFIKSYQMHFYDSYYLISFNDMMLVFMIMIVIIISITIIKLRKAFNIESMRNVL